MLKLLGHCFALNCYTDLEELVVHGVPSRVCMGQLNTTLESRLLTLRASLVQLRSFTVVII